MSSESIIVISKQKNQKPEKVFKCEVTITKNSSTHEIRLDGYYQDQPIRPYPISLKSLADVEIKNKQSSYKDVSYPTDDFGYKQECHNVECIDNPYNVIFEILDGIKSKIGEFEEISFTGTGGYLDIEKLKEKYPEIKSK